MQFVVDSLEDVAAHFDDMAERAAAAAERASAKTQGRVLSCESRTWTRAAETLRATTFRDLAA